MATPNANSVAITDVDFGELSLAEAALIDGSKWGAGGLGTGVELTYSFPWDSGIPPHYSFDYGSGELEWTGAAALDDDEQAAVIQALTSISRGANISFVETADNASVVGELRFTASSTTGGSYAHAYVPLADYPDSGDVWFSKGSEFDWQYPGNVVSPGSYEYLTIIHEIGHALGLRHPFDEGFDLEVLPPELDNYLWTVMSYTAREGAEPWVGADFYPTTLMYLDLVALETLYGAPTNANPGNTTYVYRSDQQYWETITDSGGIDTIVYDSPSHGGRIDLSNATFSRMGRPIRFDDDVATRDTIGLGPSTIIENATGGGGNDVLNGGAGVDRITGGAGNDTLLWGAGDRLNGGAGTDTLKLAGGDLDLTSIGNSAIGGTETISLKGRGDNELTLNASDILDFSSTTNTLRVLGENGDTVDLRGSFSDAGITGQFHRYQSGSAVLLVDSDITVV